MSSTLNHLYNSDNIIEGYGVARQLIKSTDKELNNTVITPSNNRKNCELHEEEIYSNSIRLFSQPVTWPIY
jgi:hypothetical protein